MGTKEPIPAPLGPKPPASPAPPPLGVEARSRHLPVEWSALDQLNSDLIRIRAALDQIEIRDSPFYTGAMAIGGRAFIKVGIMSFDAEGEPTVAWSSPRRIDSHALPFDIAAQVFDTVLYLTRSEMRKRFLFDGQVIFGKGP